MQILIEVTLPVFLIIAVGYVSALKGVFTESNIEGIVRFSQELAIPCLLFVAISGLDLTGGFAAQPIVAFYIGSLVCFFAGLFGARYLFDRDWEDAVAIGFTAFFGNTVLLGLPITDRAFGQDALANTYVIVALHAPFCYVLGIFAMELVKQKGTSFGEALIKVLEAVARNTLMIAITLGFGFSILNIEIPRLIHEPLDLIARAAIPAALFGLGGVLVRYRPEGDFKVIIWVCFLSLVIHPLITLILGRPVFGLPDHMVQSATITAAMAPGVNAYIFSNMYGRGQRVAASSVLTGTAASIITASLWVHTLA